VLAAARSCTSFVTMMLEQRPEAAGLPALKLFAFSSAGELEASFPSFWIERGIQRAHPLSCRVQRDRLPRRRRARGGMGCSITLVGNHGADGIVVAMIPHTDSNMELRPGRFLGYDAQNSRPIPMARSGRR